MSSFINSAKHFNSVERSLLKHCIHSDNFYFPSSITETIPDFAYRSTIFHKQDKFNEIMQTLRELQVLCVCLQYKDNCETRLYKEIQEQTAIVRADTAIEDLNKIALYKAMKSIDYQIEIDHLTKLRELTPQEKDAMLFLNEIIKALAEDIILDLPDYETAKWAI